MLKINVTSSRKIEKELTSILSNLNNFHSLEVVDRINETQIQVGENSNLAVKGLMQSLAVTTYYTTHNPYVTTLPV